MTRLNLLISNSSDYAVFNFDKDGLLKKTNFIDKEQNMKTLNCRDAGFDCEGKLRGETEEELLNQAAKHAQTEHNVQVTPELAQQIRAFIKDEEQ